MHRLGRIIQNLRKERSFSAAQLSSNICTTKYIYMIESGERTPSIEMLYLLSERLKYDLFSVLPYVFNNDPLNMKAVVEELYKHFQREDTEMIESILKQHKEILINKYSSLYYSMRSYVELEKNNDVSKAEEELLEGFDKLDFDFECVVEKSFIMYNCDDLQMLVQYCYVLLKSYRIEEFINIILPLYKYTLKLDMNAFSYRLIISSSLVYIDYIFYVKTEYSLALKMSQELSDRMYENSMIWLYHYLKHTEAVCCYHLNQIENFEAAKEAAVNYAADIDYVRINEFKATLDCLKTEHTDFDKDWRKDIIDSVGIRSNENKVLYNAYLMKHNILIVEFIQLDSRYLHKAAIKIRKMMDKHMHEGETYHFVVDCRYDTDKEAVLTTDNIDVYEYELRTIFTKFYRRSRTFIYNESIKSGGILKAFFNLYMLRKTEDEESEFYASSMKEALNHITAMYGDKKVSII